MKKPKIEIRIVRNVQVGIPPWSVYVCGVTLEGDHWNSNGRYCESKKAAREWAKEWCRTVGEALMKAGGCDFVMGLRKGQKAEKGEGPNPSASTAARPHARAILLAKLREPATDHPTLLLISRAERETAK